MVNSIDYDYVIIGSGFGGSVSALRLSQKGYKVLVIEKGKWYKNKDFPKTNWNLRKWLWLPLFNFFGILKLTFFRHVSVLSGVGVGGGSLVYANTLPVPKEDFFKSGNWAGIADWETELKPHYAVAEKMLGATKSPKYFDADLALQRTAKKMGQGDAFDAPNVSVYFGKADKVVQDPYFGGKGPDRSGCNFCGQCMTGCPNNAKNTLDKNYLYLAQKNGAEILAEKKVVIVKPLKNKEGSDGYEVCYENATSIFKKEKSSVKAKGVVFSGGVLGTVRLLLDMKSKNYLPNLSDKVGNHIRTNNENLSLITSRRKDIDLSKGVAIGSIFPPDKYGHVEAVRYGEGSSFWKIGIIPMVFGSNIFIRILKLLKELILHPINWLGTYFIRDYSQKTVILLFMQHLDSTIKLRRGWFNLNSKISSGPKPTPFIPMAKTIADHVANEIDGTAFMLNTDILTGAPSTAHILGGTVIGKDRSDGVIDATQKVFGYENMYVCDGSAMSANPGVNPSLTITAMTERVMNNIPSK
ncbi:MAG: GMC family oxidoreductase [Bacteroidota bacterium]